MEMRGMEWNGMILLSGGTRGGVLYRRSWVFWFHKMWRISWLAQDSPPWS